MKSLLCEKGQKYTQLRHDKSLYSTRIDPAGSGLQFLENTTLTPYNSLGMSSTARWFCEVATFDELQEALGFARSKGLPVFPLGGGTNIVLMGNLDALVVRNRLQGISIDGSHVTVGSGENWHEFVCATLDSGLFGLENLALIPGTTGAAPIQNIGAYGVELTEYFESLTAIELKTGESVELGLADCQFGYRTSRFRVSQTFFITELRLCLLTEDQPNIEYPGIADYLSQRQLATNARNVFDAVVAIRQSKLPDPEREPNVGSFFKNPVVEAETVTELLKANPDMPHYGAGDATGPLEKLPAAWLIEQAGLKGRAKGGFQVSPQHALVIVNRQQGSATELKQLILEIQERVLERFGVGLEVEPGIYPE